MLLLLKEFTKMLRKLKILSSKRFVFNRRIYFYFLCSLVFLCSESGFTQNLKAGIGKKVITPELPFLLTGYAGRVKPATEKVHDLWAKALIIESAANEKLLIVTIDILGLTPQIANNITNTLIKKYKFQRSQIILNASHTHSGPFIWPALGMIGDYDSTTLKSFVNYNRQLTKNILGAVDLAVKDLSPVVLSSGHGLASFAQNRRQYTNKGVVNGINPEGSVDHDVPVLKVTSVNAEVKAILFGYACHNTAATGANNIISGDYAGYAQVALEKKYVGTVALFLNGCSGDQNPQPRGTLQLAEQHGLELAAAVENVISGKMKQVHGKIKGKLQLVQLRFKPYSMEEYQSDIIGSNPYKQRRARLMIEAYNKQWDIKKYEYPVQAIRIGSDLTFLALGGEVVVDYALKTKKKYQKDNLFIAGYCNHVICYIPTKKILQEGGYEAEDNLIYYGMPGPFENDIESKIDRAISEVMKK